MSENISSNVLFYFTNSLDSIVDILTNGFYPHYCPEYSFGPLHDKTASSGKPPTHASPMICFCDLPLSLIRKHLETYGNFGIGLKKEWGIRNGVTPVLYTHGKSQLFKALSNRMWAASDQGDEGANIDLKFLAAFLKPYRGNAWRDGKTKPDIHFYDEREWRYVPRVAANEQIFLPREVYTNKEKLVKLYASFKEKCKLTVHPDDIQYLIVPEDGHILELVEHLRSLYNPDDATLVTTAIMTIDCIHEDV